MKYFEGYIDYFSFLALPEEVVNVSFYGNINKKRNNETKDLTKDMSGDFRNLSTTWVYKNEEFVFADRDTLRVQVGFLLRSGERIWDVRTFEIKYWRLHSLGMSTTTVTPTIINMGMFDIFQPNLGKLNHAFKRMIMEPNKITSHPLERGTRISTHDPGAWKIEKAVDADMSDAYMTH